MTCGECVHLNAIPGREACSPRGRRDPAGPAGDCGWAFPCDQLKAALYGQKRKPATPLVEVSARPDQGELFA